MEYKSKYIVRKLYLLSCFFPEKNVWTILSEEGTFLWKITRLKILFSNYIFTSHFQSLLSTTCFGKHSFVERCQPPSHLFYSALCS